MSSDRYAVMGAIWRMQAEHVRPFADTLRRTGFAGRTVLFVAHTDPATVAELQALADEVVVVERPTTAGLRVAVRLLRAFKTTRGLRRHFPQVFAAVVRLAPSSRRRQWWESLEFELQGLQSLRYSVYRDYLERHGDELDGAMIADIRDVVFQADPFVDGTQGLRVFLEKPGNELFRPGFNRTWGHDLYFAEWDSIASSRVSCSGVTLGDAASMTRYVATMATEIASVTIPMGPHDQAAHNWLLYNGRLDPVTMIENGTGEVFTVDLHRCPALDDHGRVINADGSVPAVVHQYDRHAALVEALAPSPARVE